MDCVSGVAVNTKITELCFIGGHMILEIKGLTSAQFASISAFLDSKDNILPNAYMVGRSFVGKKHDQRPPTAGHLVRSKGCETGLHDVVIELPEDYVRILTEDEERSAAYARVGSTGRTVVPVPLSYLIGLVHAMGRFPEN